MTERIANHIVAGVDGSSRAAEAAAFAVYLARALGGRVTLAAGYVHDPVHPGGRREASERALDGLAAAHRDAGVHLTTLAIPVASPVLALQELARRQAATLLVVGESHVGEAGRVFPGSTAERLVHGAPCPVVVVPAGWSRTFESAPRTIAVATNGSAESCAAVEQAVQLALDWPARLRLYSVCNLDPYAMGLPLGLAATVFQDSREREARQRLDAAVAELPDPVLAEGVLLFGDAAHAIAEHTDGLALLVVGSRGYGPLRSVVAGAVSGWLLRHASCPVMVVPRASAAASRSTAAETAGVSALPSEKSPPSMA